MEKAENWERPNFGIQAHHLRTAISHARAKASQFLNVQNPLGFGLLNLPENQTSTQLKQDPTAQQRRLKRPLILVRQKLVEGNQSQILIKFDASSQ